MLFKRRCIEVAMALRNGDNNLRGDNKICVTEGKCTCVYFSY